jgi:hypothetical protein
VKHRFGVAFAMSMCPRKIKENLRPSATQAKRQ